MKSGWHWPVLLALLLSLGVAANLYFVARAVSDPSFAVEPDYYQKAVAWDAHQAQARENAALGWSLALAVAPADPATGRARLVAQVIDRDGHPVPGLTVVFEAFHNARASEIVTARLPETANHDYAADVAVQRPGLWEFRLLATRGTERFTAVVDQDAPGEAEVTGLVVGVFASSLLGSVHCAGMCGPLVAAYTGMPASDAPWRRRALAHGTYSVGRLAAYLALGALAGAFGAAADHAASWMGIARAAAIVSGTLIALTGLHALLEAASVRVPRLQAPTSLKRGLGCAMRAAAARPPAARAMILGLASALLPCGWLYAFAVTAGGTGSVLRGVLVMAVFWTGTLPVMVAFGEAVARLSGPLRRHVPATCALVLMILGLWTVFGRSHLVPMAAAADAAKPACHGTR